MGDLLGNLPYNKISSNISNFWTSNQCINCQQVAKDSRYHNQYSRCCCYRQEWSRKPGEKNW